MAAVPKLTLRFSAALPNLKDKGDKYEELSSPIDRSRSTTSSPTSISTDAYTPPKETLLSENKPPSGPKSLRLILKPQNLKRKLEETEDHTISYPPPTKKRQRRRSKVIRINKKVFEDSSSDENYIQDGFKTLSGRTIINPNARKAASLQLNTTATENNISPSTPSSDEPEASCTVCLRTPDTPDDQIVFCDGCDQAYHQSCHVPVIDDSFVRVAEKSWFCKDCGPPLPPALPSTITTTTTATIIPNTSSTEYRDNGTSASINANDGESLTQDDKILYLNTLTHQKLISMILDLEKLAPGVSLFPPDIHETIKQLHTALPNKHSEQEERDLEEPIIKHVDDTNINTDTSRQIDTEPPAAVNTITKNGTDEDDTLWTDDPDNPTVSHRIYSVNGIKVSNSKGWVSPTELRNSVTSLNNGIRVSDITDSTNTAMVA
ncbi:hypothetical protein TWF694_002825 [Orbilia ellipsospora]|uniref:PHD-type domain-containing protein n=1 Tax=Orbilia ellipsospora TaxID=2528407 RepID=A0AAV9X111_9PEZI